LSERAPRLAVDVLAVFGPTGSGKTAVAGTLADALGTEVVGADSMQLYRGLEILTNQPDRPTRLVGVADLSHEMSVGEYVHLAHGAIDELVRSRGSAVVAGGTGLYLRAALADLQLPPRVDADVRASWEAAYDADPERAFAALRARDPRAAEVVHRNDRRRVVRALELSEAGASLVRPRSRLWSEDLRRPTLVAGLEVPADALADRIERRTREMFERGVVAEVRAALARSGLSRTAEQALGLREVVELPPHEARAAIVARTLRYAAYQRKWMRRIAGIVMIDADRPAEEVADAILEMARAR
jgi:tRNA dimethylallyltransferase